jgi:Domain of unknown function (DUF3850)
MVKTHELKTVHPHFQDVWTGHKTFEIRWNDRGFQVGDTLVLKEYVANDGYYSGRKIEACVTHILPSEKFLSGIKPGYVVMSIKEVGRSHE